MASHGAGGLNAHQHFSFCDILCIAPEGLCVNRPPPSAMV